MEDAAGPGSGPLEAGRRTNRAGPPAPARPAIHRSLDSFAREIDGVAAAHNTTRAEVLRTLIASLEERIAEDSAVLALARRLEAAGRKPAETAFDTAIDIVARGGGQRPWRGK